MRMVFSTKEGNLERKSYAGSLYILCGSIHDDGLTATVIVHRGGELLYGVDDITSRGPPFKHYELIGCSSRTFTSSIGRNHSPLYVKRLSQHKIQILCRSRWRQRA